MGQAKLLYGYFSQIDTTLRGEITLLELWQFLSMDCTGFTERVREHVYVWGRGHILTAHGTSWGRCEQAFSVFDEDGNGTVDFGEFLVSLYNYCAWWGGEPGARQNDGRTDVCSGYLVTQAHTPAAR